MNEAFLERFSITLEQEYPAQKTEMKILNNVLKAAGVTEFGDFTEMLTNWSDVIRKTFVQGGSNELVTTRRLVHIC
ncbi:hypothetical protein PTM75_15045, partial [Clostridium perfringens]|nr:hypothetical protein [Clostridium perfringens]